MRKKWRAVIDSLTEHFISSSETKVALIKCLLCAIYFTLHSCILLVTHSNSRWSGWFGHFLRQSCLDCECQSVGWGHGTGKWEMQEPGLAVPSSLARADSAAHLHLLPSSLVWFSSGPLCPCHSFPKECSVAAVSLVLLLESLTRCSCVGHLGWASSPLSGTWRACSRQGGSMVRGTELGLWSWDLVLNRFCHKQLCIWGQTTESGHPPASCEADIITWPTGCSRIPWASAQEAMVSGRVLFEERCIMLWECCCSCLLGSPKPLSRMCPQGALLLAASCMTPSFIR